MPRSSRRFGGIVVTLAVVALLVGVGLVYGRAIRCPGRVRPKAGVAPRPTRAGPRRPPSSGEDREAQRGLRGGPPRGQGRPDAPGGRGGRSPAGPASSRWTRPGTTGSRRSPPTRTRPWSTLLVTRYGAPKPCPGQLPHAVHRRSRSASDNGATWTAGEPLCACKGSGQFDPIIEVVPRHRPRLRALHERLQRRLHEVDRTTAQTGRRR